jgi:uncharacterized protein
MNFEWDETKRLINLAKHGVDFIDIVPLFDHPCIEKLDGRRNYGEDRIIIVGAIHNEVFIVVYTWRGEKRRLISARKAGKNARKKYYASYPQTGA